MNELALFAGTGGGILGGHLLGWRCVCAVEREAYARDVLVSRQNDGHLPPFPIWDDVCTFDGRPWRGIVDVVSGGFPCQDISSAGKGAGIQGEKSGLWREMARIVGEVRPRFVFVENSPMLVRRGLAMVLGDLTSLGYDARWCVLGAVDAGAPHKRDRIWIIATNTNSNRQHAMPINAEVEVSQELVDNANIRRHGAQEEEIQSGRDGDFNASWWKTEPNMGRVAHGVANRVDRLRAIGNGQVPAVVRLAWETLRGEP